LKKFSSTLNTIVLLSTLTLGLASCAGIEGMNSDKATVYFETGKHHLTSQAKSTLDTFASSLQGEEVNGVTVTGFADHRGSDKANSALSKRRATTVGSYLNHKGVQGVKTAVVNAVGESQSTTVCETKKGTSQCLSPDRKVEVEVDTAPRMIQSGSNTALNHSNLQDRHRVYLNK
jgi:outer membrane protein OmpA-like peptidoglycan-associated protein